MEEGPAERFADDQLAAAVVLFEPLSLGFDGELSPDFEGELSVDVDDVAVSVEDFDSLLDAVAELVERLSFL